MKRKLSLCLALFMFILSFSNFSVAAATNIPLWESSVTTKTVTVTQGDGPNDEWTSYRYIPTETKEYAIKLPYVNNNYISISVRTIDDIYVDRDHWMGESYEYYILNLTAGQEYVVSFYGVNYTGEISIVKWDTKYLLPDHPFIQEDEKKAVNVTIDDYAYFLFTAKATDTYCFGHNTDDISVDLSPTYKTTTQQGHHPEELGNWHTDIPTTQRGTLYRLEKGNTYLISIRARGFNQTVTDTVWIRQGEAPTDTWSANILNSVTLKLNQEATYHLTPSESGKYMVLGDGRFIFDVFDKKGNSALHSEFTAPDHVSGYIFNLTGGQKYTVSVRLYRGLENGETSATGKFRFEKVGAVKSVSLYIVTLTDNSCTIGIDSDPVCAGYLDGVKWSISNTADFEITNSYNGGIELQAKKKGKKTTVTAKIGSITTSIEVDTTAKPPVLEEGKTFTVNGTVGRSGTAAVFTPAKSGKYEFTITPKRIHPDQKVNMSFIIGYDLDQDPTYYKSNITGKYTFTVNLKAGRKYYISKYETRYSVVYKYVGAASSSGDTSSKDNNASTSPGINDNTPIPAVKIMPFTVTGSENVFLIDNDSLQQAVTTGSAIQVDFPEDVSIQLDNAVITSLCGVANGEGASLHSIHEELSDLNDEQQKALKDKDLALLLDLKLTVGDNEIHQLGGNALVTIPNPDKDKNWNVLYIAEDGAIETMDITCDDTITFATNHFSHYALVSDIEKTTTDKAQNKWILPVIICLVLIGGGTGAFFFLKKKNFFKK